MRAVPTVIITLSLGLSLVAVGIALSRSSIGGTSASTPSNSNLESRIAQLEEELEMLLSARRPETNQSNGKGLSGDSSSEVESRLEALEALVSPLISPPGSPAEETFTAEEIERTRRALAEVRREEMGEMISRWIDKEREKSDRLLTTVEEKLNLPWHEQKRVREIMTDEADSHAQILEEMWSIKPPANRFEEEAIAAQWDLATIRMKEIRHKRDEELHGLLGKKRFDELLELLRLANRPQGSQKSR